MFFRNVMLAEYGMVSQSGVEIKEIQLPEQKKFKNLKKTGAFQALTVLFELPTCYRSCLWLFLGQTKCIKQKTAFNPRFKGEIAYLRSKKIIIETAHYIFSKEAMKNRCIFLKVLPVSLLTPGSLYFCQYLQVRQAGTCSQVVRISEQVRLESVEEKYKI